MGCQQSTVQSSTSGVETSVCISTSAANENLKLRILESPVATSLGGSSTIAKESMATSLGGNSVIAEENLATSYATTVSLEVDEERSDSLPKVDHNGFLVEEEIVRRTSSSLQCSSISIGSKEKGGKQIVGLEVSARPLTLHLQGLLHLITIHSLMHPFTFSMHTAVREATIHTVSVQDSSK